MTHPTREAFNKQVHRALRHLYEPVELRMSPLGELFGISSQTDLPSSLRTILLNAIRAFKPDPKVSTESNAWRSYQVLCYRFEEQSSQEEVAEQMAVSPRQVRRLEFTAIHALADYLMNKYSLVLAESEAQAELPSEETDSLTADSLTEASQVETVNEFDWLKRSYQREATDVGKLVESALKTGEAMLRAKGVNLLAGEIPDLPPILGQMTTLRQALLNILIDGMHSCPEGTLQVQAVQAGQWVHIDVVGTPNGEKASSPNEFLEIARQLAALSEGSLEVQPPDLNWPFAARLILPLAKKFNILFVDDNEDILNLMQRYLSDTQFVFFGTRDPETVFALLTECMPSLIVLDIMLPDIDGWELLGRLRAHPRLDGVPVVISTILPHEQLAASLGAAGFLRKPVSQENLLQILTQLINTAGIR